MDEEGNRCRKKNVAMRLTGSRSVYCIGCFFLVQVYGMTSGGKPDIKGKQAKAFVQAF